MQRRRRIAKEKAKARAQREAERAKTAGAKLERQLQANLDKKLNEAERTEKKHEEAERLRRNKKDAKIAALEKRKAEKLAKTQKWMDQQAAAKEKAEAAAFAAEQANRRELEAILARKEAKGRQGFDKDDHEARQKREKQFTLRQKSGTVEDEQPEGDNVLKKPLRRKVRRSILERNRVAGLEMQGKYGFDDPLDEAFGDDSYDGGRMLPGTLSKGGHHHHDGGDGTELEPDQFILTPKQQKAEEIKAKMANEGRMSTYADLFSWLDKGEGGASDYMSLHDDYYSEEDDDEFDEEEMCFTLDALKKMPNLRKVQKVYNAPESAWGKKSTRT